MPKTKIKTQTIGEQIREARELHGVSQAALADAAGVSQSAISYIESGAVFPAFATLESICDFLELRFLLSPSGRKRADSGRNS